MIKIAFGSVPKDGGTFTFYRNLRPALLGHGIDLRCVTVGKREASLCETAYVDEGCILLAPNVRSVKRQAMAFADWCEQVQVDIVLGINSEAILSALPHLPERIRCMARCANSFDHGYRITLSGYERLAAIVAQTPRQFKDLTKTYGAAPGKITIIPNGIDPTPFRSFGVSEGRSFGVSGGRCFRGAEDGVSGGPTADRQPPTANRPPTADRPPPAAHRPLQLGFLGRLEHKQKGVLFLPEIVRELNRLEVPFKLRIAGKGKHESILRKELAEELAAGQVQMVGALAPAQVPAFLAETEVFLFPSQFEGCPNALIEAMMAGCVPVAWKLEGITDFLIEDGVSGFLCDCFDCIPFSRNIADLYRQQHRLQTIGFEAARKAEAEFSTTTAGDSYSELFSRVMKVPPPSWESLPWQRFHRNSNFQNRWDIKSRLIGLLKRSFRKNA